MIGGIGAGLVGRVIERSPLKLTLHWYSDSSPGCSLDNLFDKAQYVYFVGIYDTNKVGWFSGRASLTRNGDSFYLNSRKAQSTFNPPASGRLDIHAYTFEKIEEYSDAMKFYDNLMKNKPLQETVAYKYY